MSTVVDTRAELQKASWGKVTSGGTLVLVSSLSDERSVRELIGSEDFRDLGLTVYSIGRQVAIQGTEAGLRGFMDRIGKQAVDLDAIKSISIVRGGQRENIRTA